MSKVIKEWLRRWLGIEDIYQQTCQVAKDRREFDNLTNGRIDNIIKSITQWSDDWEKLITLEREQRHAQVLTTQNFVPAMNQRITALEETSVNGVGVEAIAKGAIDQATSAIRMDFARQKESLLAEISDLTAAVDSHNARLVKLEIAPKPVQEKKKEPPTRRPIHATLASIERQEQANAEI